MKKSTSFADQLLSVARDIKAQEEAAAAAAEKAQQERMAKVPHIFPIGHKVLVIANKNAFCATRRFGEAEPEVNQLQHFLSKVHIVEITITEERIVPAHESFSDLYYGYLGIGSDGWQYTCQWERFDNGSTAPYGTWHRHYEEGKHYQDSPFIGDPRKWFVPVKVRTDHHLNLDLVGFQHIPLEMMPGLIKFLAQVYPDTQLELCTKPCDPGEHVKGELKTHAAYGLYYKKTGCFMCQFLAEQSKQGKVA